MNNQKPKQNTYVVKTKYLAKFLVDRGFEMIYTGADRFKPQYDVYIFRYKDEMLSALDEYHILKSYRIS